MAVYGYIRVSTAKQVAEDTPDTQRDTIERLATEHNLLVDRIFEDDAYTGNTDKPEQRPGFGALLSKIKPGDTIIMSQLNRIVRHGMVLMKFVSQWQYDKIKIIVDNEFDQQACDRPVYLGMVCELAEMKLKEVSTATKAGMRRVMAETDEQRRKNDKKRVGRPAKNQWYNKQDIIDALTAGERPDVIAKRFNVGVATVYRIRKAAATAIA
ncbi:recombinase family protein (plasmid) [Escherichia coli]|nr:recombinase family protein [Escherichia coli]